MTETEPNPTQVAELLPSVYSELRKIAAATMAKLPAGSTLQPTALVHEAWLRRARQRRAIRHGGDQQRVVFERLESRSTRTMTSSSWPSAPRWIGSRRNKLEELMLATDADRAASPSGRVN